MTDPNVAYISFVFGITFLVLLVAYLVTRDTPPSGML
jgi:hypothetical protein